MKHLLPLLILLAAAPLLAGLSFRNLDDKAHICGPKLSPKDLAGKVIAVEEFGYQCPPCRASLPHMAKLAKSLAGKPVVFLGSHVQGRADEAVIKLMQGAKCEYPVYQWFAVNGAPKAIGIPHAYVYDSRGNMIWHGDPYGDYAAFEKAILTAAKAASKAIPNSLVEGLEIKHCKDLARRLTFGQNIEPVLKTLQARSAKGGPAGEEAKAILAHLDAWAETTAADLRQTLESSPSQALAMGQPFCRTLPSRTAEFREPLANAAKDPLTRRLATARQNLLKLRATKAETPNAKKALLAKVNQQLRQLTPPPGTEETEDLRNVRQLWEAFAKELK